MSGDSLVFIPLFISLVSGYLVVAWLVGKQLARAQVVLINSLYITFLVLLAFSWTKRVFIGISYQSELMAMNPNRVEVLGPWLVPIISVLGIILILACLKFMWDIRHPKAK
jgi:hypothetical protein